MKKYLLLAIFLSFLAVWPFFKNGYFSTHDGDWMIIRFSAFHQTLAAGQFPVRFVDRLNNNYGYPVLNFLYPLPFYLAEIPKLAGFGFVNSIKIVSILSVVVSVAAMFWALRQKFNDLSSFAGSIIYVFAPYRFIDLYVRGSLGENVAFALIPIALGAIFKIANNKKNYLPLFSISIGLIILAHNVLALLFLPVLALIAFLEIKKEYLILTAYILLGIATAAFFWMPAILDLPLVKLSQIQITDPAVHLVPFEKLIYSAWGWGPSVKGEDSFSGQIGPAATLIIIFALFLFLRNREKDRLFRFSLTSALASIIFISPLSHFFWEGIKAAAIIQYPWRILSIVVFFTAILMAYVSQKVGKPLFTYAFVLLCIVISLPFAKPRVYVNYPDSYYSTNEDTTTVQDEYLPNWARQKLQRAQSKINLHDNLMLVNEEIKSTNYKWVLETQNDTTATVNTIYFPGFKGKLDQEALHLNYQNEYGLINFQLPKGRHEVIINYAKSPAHLASELISLIALCTLGFILLKTWKVKIS